MNDLLETRDGRVVTLTMNRPESMNALTDAMNRSMTDAFRRLSADLEIGAIVLTGAGRAFCAGGDVKQMRGRAEDSPQTLEAEMRWKQALPLAIRDCSKLVIAAVNGPTVGAGLALALAADFRLMSEAATLHCGFGAVGLSGDFGISYALTRLIGPAKAKELMILQKRLAADEALRLGVVSHVHAAEDFQAAVMVFAKRLAGGPTMAWSCIKQNVASAENETFAAMLEIEIRNQAKCMATAEYKEALLAFAARRSAAHDKG